MRRLWLGFSAMIFAACVVACGGGPNPQGGGEVSERDRGPVRSGNKPAGSEFAHRPLDEAAAAELRQAFANNRIGAPRKYAGVRFQFRGQVLDVGAFDVVFVRYTPLGLVKVQLDDGHMETVEVGGEYNFAAVVSYLGELHGNDWAADAEFERGIVVTP